jgi:hypothetical protein
MNQVTLTLLIPEGVKPTTLEQTHKYMVMAHGAADIFAQRQEKYGKGNISRFGLIGTIIRMHDKMERLIQLTEGAGGDAVDESVEDTLMDLANYALIGLMCHKGIWDGPIPQADPEATQEVLQEGEPEGEYQPGLFDAEEEGQQPDARL